MSAQTLLYAQSGGVTAVINASASAVIQTARAHKVKVLAARNGILGALNEDLIDTSKEPIAAIRALAHTPGGAFGSCRFKLKSLDADRAHYQRLIERSEEHTSELQSLMRISYAVFCLKKNTMTHLTGIGYQPSTAHAIYL